MLAYVIDPPIPDTAAVALEVPVIEMVLVAVPFDVGENVRLIVQLDPGWRVAPAQLSVLPKTLEDDVTDVIDCCEAEVFVTVSVRCALVVLTA